MHGQDRNVPTTDQTESAPRHTLEAGVAELPKAAQSSSAPCGNVVADAGAAATAPLADDPLEPLQQPLQRGRVHWFV
jgi:hypothetical protein